MKMGIGNFIELLLVVIVSAALGAFFAGVNDALKQKPVFADVVQPQQLAETYVCTAAPSIKKEAKIEGHH